MTLVPHVRVCQKCSLVKKIEEFSKHSSRKDKLNTRCKTCDSLTWAQKASAQREKVRQVWAGRQQSGGVYLISADDGYVKIGVFSGDVNRRLKSLQTGNPKQLRVVETVLCDLPLYREQVLHKRYKNLHVRGEWFRYSPEINLHA